MLASYSAPAGRQVQPNPSNPSATDESVKVSGYKNTPGVGGAHHQCAGVRLTRHHRMPHLLCCRRAVASVSAGGRGGVC